MAEAERTRLKSHDSQGKGQIRKDLIIHIKDFGFYLMSDGKPLELLRWSVALTGLIFRKDCSNCYIKNRLEDIDLETGKPFISVYCDNPGKRDG